MNASGLSPNPSSFYYSRLSAPSASYALLFDGIQNFVTLGLMGGFGSAIGTNNGFYLSFDLIISNTPGQYILGKSETGAKNIEILANADSIDGRLRISVGDATKDTSGYFTNASVVDGSKHTITFQVTPSTNTIVATFDGINQSVHISEAETPDSFVNFGKAFYIGAKDENGLVSGTIEGTLDNFKIGTSAAVLYGNYAMNEGTGTTIADTSGQGNTGTLSGTPKPTWVTIS